MTIKHTGKNISAESENIITNVTFNDATGVLTFYQKNLYNGNTTSFSRDLSGVQLGVVKLADQNALNTLKNDSTKEDYKKTHLFLVPLSGNNTEGVFAEYVYVETSTNVWDFERLGSTELDLSDYINTAGSGLSKSGTVLNHSNNISPQTSAVFKKIKYDAQGHITEIDNVTASDLPSHTHDDKYYTENEIDVLLSGKSNINHNHIKSEITDFPNIPSSSTDLSDGSDLIKKSSINGLVKNDGTIDTNTYATTSSIPTKTSDLTNDSGFLTSHQSLTNYIQKSNTSGLVKNDGTIDTNTYLTQHQDISGKADAVHNHTSNDITDMDTVTITVTYTDNTTDNLTLTLFKQTSNS